MPKLMSRNAFVRWRGHMGYTQREASKALGVGESTIRRWEGGRGAPDAAPPYHMRLACAALSNGLAPYGWDPTLGNDGAMSPSAFREFRKLLGVKHGARDSLSRPKTAELLGLSSEETLSYWEAGKRRDGKPAAIDRPIALACAALLNDVEPWSEEE